MTIDLSRDELTGIAVIATTVAVLSWYQADMTGGQRWTTAAIAFLASIVTATAVTVLLRTWDPAWYRS